MVTFISKQLPPAYPNPPLVSSAKVLFIGGINSRGSKGSYIQRMGYNTLIPQLSSNNSITTAAWCLPGLLRSLSGIDGYKQSLLAEVYGQLKDFVPDIIVGSSQGGALAMIVQKEKFPSANLLLLAPAWKTFDVEPLVPQNTIIIHGRKDWLVSPRESKILANKSDCKLILMDDDHHLGDSYSTILEEVDNISEIRKQHKDEILIKKEWTAYRKECQEWLAQFGPKSTIITVP